VAVSGAKRSPTEAKGLTLKRAQNEEGTMSINLVNCTPHPVSVRTAGGGGFIHLPASSTPARCAVVVETLHSPLLVHAWTEAAHGLMAPCEDGCTEQSDGAWMVGGVRHGALVAVTSSSLGKVTDLPDEQQDTAYIVSRVVAEALPGRDDLYFPADLLRDGAGHVTGCKGLSRP